MNGWCWWCFFKGKQTLLKGVLTIRPRTGNKFFDAWCPECKVYGFSIPFKTEGSVTLPKLALP